MEENHSGVVSDVGQYQVGVKVAIVINKTSFSPCLGEESFPSRIPVRNVLDVIEVV